MFFLLTLWQRIEQWDQSLFLLINRDWANPVFDSLMPFMRTSNHWMPLYLFLFVFVLLNFKGKGLWWFVFFLSTIALTDMTGTYLFKHNIERLRPCNDPEMFSQVRLLLKNCAGGYSFISNHAANHFGMATFFFLSFRKLIPKIAWIGFLWAALVAYSQVYVGVHYPLDVLAGAMLGMLLGNLTAYIFNKRFGFHIFDNQPMAVS
jgi:undecaprenyl-diphosphatase